MATTRVILSSSTHPDYAFSVGIAALLWRDLVWYRPWTFLVGTSSEWVGGKQRVALDFMRELELYAHRIEQLEEWPAYVTAQNCRYHAAELDFGDDEWLMLSDADLFPLKRDFYHQHEDYDGRFAFYYANGDSYANYPTCHIAARACDWRDVMALDGYGHILQSMRRNLSAWFAPLAKTEHEIWVSDMHSFMSRIKSKPWHPAECKMIEREGHPPKDRLDRSNWPASYNVDDYTDAHILKNPCENWPRLRPMIERLIPQHLKRLDKYAEDFARA